MLECEGDFNTACTDLELVQFRRLSGWARILNSRSNKNLRLVETLHTNKSRIFAIEQQLRHAAYFAYTTFLDKGSEYVVAKHLRLQLERIVHETSGPYSRDLSCQGYVR